MIKQALVNKETERFYHYYKYTVVSEAVCMFWYNKTLVEFDLVHHQISFAEPSDVRFSFCSSNITCPGKTNLMLD